MTTPAIVRCRGCGVPNVAPAPACVSCGTLLPRAPAAHELLPPTPGVPEGAASEPAAAIAALQRHAAGVIRVFLATLGLSVAAMVAVKAGAPAAQVDVAVTSVFVAITAICVVAARRQLAPLFRRTGGWRVGIGAIATFGAMCLFGLFYFEGLRRLGAQTLKVAEIYLEAGWPSWTAYLLVAVAPGISEELVFRGYVMARLEPLLSAAETLVVQAALFSLLHLGVVILPSHFVFGLILGIARRRTGSLLPGMAAHIAWNATIVATELASRPFP